MWDLHHILRTARAGLERASLASVEEQAVYGIDALCEVDLHPIIADTFRSGGFTAMRERHYPGEPGTRAKYSARRRCDVVLLPQAGQHLIDPVAELMQRDKAAGTLFEAGAATVASIAGVRPEDAFWLEVKLVGQYCYTQGVPGPNRAYSSELTNSLYVDLAKISADAALKWSALLLVLFSDTEATAAHDLPVALHRSLDRGYSFRSPITESFDIPDRIGNRVCTVAVIPR